MFGAGRLGTGTLGTLEILVGACGAMRRRLNLSNGSTGLPEKL